MDQASRHLEYAQGFKGVLVADGMQSRPPPESSQDGIQMSPPQNWRAAPHMKQVYAGGADQTKYSIGDPSPGGVAP
jgi:hypothetical protein